MLRTIIMVPVIMACALVGTVGLMKAIQKFSPRQHGKNEQNTTFKKDE